MEGGAVSSEYGHEGCPKGATPGRGCRVRAAFADAGYALEHNGAMVSSIEIGQFSAGAP